LKAGGYIQSFTWRKNKKWSASDPFFKKSNTNAVLLFGHSLTTLTRPRCVERVINASLDMKRSNIRKKKKTKVFHTGDRAIVLERKMFDHIQLKYRGPKYTHGIVIAPDPLDGKWYLYDNRLDARVEYDIEMISAAITRIFNAIEFSIQV
jgi:hypothetical protein